MPRAVRPPASDDDATDYSDEPSTTQRKKSTGSKRKATQSKDKGKGKRRKSRAASSDEDVDSDADSDEDGGRKKGELTEDEKKHYIQAMVRFALFNEAHRKPFKREDMVKHVFAVDARGKHLNALFPRAQKVLREVLGMEMVQLRPKEGGAKSQAKAWTLRSTLPLPLIRHAASTSSSSSFASKPSFPDAVSSSSTGAQRKKLTLKAELAAWERDGEGLADEGSEDEDGEGEARGVLRDVKREEGAAYGILGVVLALILVNGKVLGDDQLISYLRRLSLYPSTPIPLSLSHPPPTGSSAKHETLSTFLNALLRAQYLERGKSGHAAATQGGATQTQKGGSRTQGPARTQRTTAGGEKAETGDPGVEWRWGPRAEAEIGERGVAKFVERIFLAESSGETEKGGKGGKGKGGERFMNEVARAAGVKELQDAEDVDVGGVGRKEKD
ncbi:hypothetical protein JCM8097_007220 [Rhodosporidiobolus ruineniae]